MTTDCVSRSASADFADRERQHQRLASLSRLGGIILCIVVALCCAACGTSSTTTGAATTPTATNCPQPTGRATIGTIQSINGNTFQVTARNGSSVNVSYSSTTRFIREALVTSSALQEGMAVTVAVKQNADSTYTATTISLLSGNASQGQGNFGQGRGNGQGQRRNAACTGNGGVPGTPRSTNSGNARNGNTTNARAIRGSVGQLSGNKLTVTDATGNDYTVTVTSDTKILQTSTVNASALQNGEDVTLFGKKDTKGVIQAQTITILPPGSVNTSAS